MKLTLLEKRPEAGDATSFIFKPEIPLTWRAGQFLHYNLPHPNPDERKLERYFTIASAPFEQNVRLTTRRSEQGSSFKTALFTLPIGGTIEADGLEGDFTVDDPAKEFIFIAGGIGITPYRSILLDLDHRGLPINGQLLYANRDEELIFQEELEALVSKHEGFKIKYFIAQEKIDETAIGQVAPDLQRPFFYVSGPEPMVESFEKMLLAVGVPDAQFKRDFFPGYDWP